MQDFKTSDPEALFVEHFTRAQAGLGEAAARMALATCDSQGQPSVRIVFHRPGPCGRVRFFTSLRGRKAGEIRDNPKVAVAFYWDAFNEQVRLEGTLREVDRGEAETYFRGRPVASQVAATLSPQSSPITSIHELRQEHQRVLSALGPEPLPLPEHWGGFELVPQRIEFWLRGEARLHHRTLYERQGDGWQTCTLAP